MRTGTRDPRIIGAFALEERDDRFADCDYIFLCAPVSTNISYLPFVKGIAKPGCIITDVGSVKGEIHQAVETLGMTHQFIGGHPMAGSEKTGYSSATDYLLENAYYMITPGPDVEIATVSAFVDLVQQKHRQEVLAEQFLQELDILFLHC